MKHEYQSVSIIIPVYNERVTIKEIINRVVRANTLTLHKEIIVIDDGSTDGTRKELDKLKHLIDKVILFTRNYGKGYAIRQGITRAKGDIVVIQDADLEYDPNDYPVLLAPIIAGQTKVVFGSRELTINTHSYPSFFLGGKLVTLMTRVLFGGRLTDVNTGYKVFDRKLLGSLKLVSTGFELCPEVTALLLQKHVNITEVPVRYRPRTFREGKKISFRDGFTALLTLLRIRIS